MRGKRIFGWDGRSEDTLDPQVSSVNFVGTPCPRGRRHGKVCDGRDGSHGKGVVDPLRVNFRLFVSFTVRGISVRVGRTDEDCLNE